MGTRVGIADYGIGNLQSVANAVHAVGGEPELVIDPDKLATFDRLILPGVGAFGDAITRLRETGMGQALDELVAQGRPVLGLCLGMQLMCRQSEEGGDWQGLGWFDAMVRRFPESLGVKVPHIGWNNLAFPRSHWLLQEVPTSPDVYFVHSYRVECADQADVLAWCDYGEPFAAIIARDNVVGIQFHPEKSQRAGLAMIRNFLEQAPC